MNDLINKPNHYNIGGAEHKGNSEQDYAKARKYHGWLERMQ